MKNAAYDALQGGQIVVQYDETAPCKLCGEPVVEASMGGTDVCPWCDSGYNRNGTKWTATDFNRIMKKVATHLKIKGQSVPP